ncbi:MAG: cell division protein ZapA [Tissierellia bacterium]|nr:cell division protein ZapA [Tissierellia bacterium]
MSAKSKVTIKILEYDFTLTGYDEPKYLEDLGEKVNSIIKELRSRNPKLNQTESLILAALNLCDDLEKEKQKSERVIENLKGDLEQKKILEYEKKLEELEALKRKNNELNDSIEKLKSAENYASQKAQTELKKSKELYSKNENLIKQREDDQKLIEDLKKENQKFKQINFETQTENVKLKKEIQESIDRNYAKNRQKSGK